VTEPYTANALRPGLADTIRVGTDRGVLLDSRAFDDRGRVLAIDLVLPPDVDEATAFSKNHEFRAVHRLVAGTIGPDNDAMMTEFVGGSVEWDIVHGHIGVCGCGCQQDCGDRDSYGDEWPGR
jgi:hypothetical protein